MLLLSDEFVNAFRFVEVKWSDEFVNNLKQGYVVLRLCGLLFGAVCESTCGVES